MCVQFKVCSATLTHLFSAFILKCVVNQNMFSLTFVDLRWFEFIWSCRETRLRLGKPILQNEISYIKEHCANVLKWTHCFQHCLLLLTVSVSVKCVFTDVPLLFAVAGSGEGLARVWDHRRLWTKALGVRGEYVYKKKEENLQRKMLLDVSWMNIWSSYFTLDFRFQILPSLDCTSVSV